jgi:ribosomal-protein-alanine N-acetyltransferase
VPELQRLRADQASAVLAFELANRAYFASFISDRGDEFFEHFDETYSEWLAEQDAGNCALHVLIDEDGTVVGLFNLRDIEGGSAVLGYRVGQEIAGHGVATATVQEVCRIAAQQYGLRILRAATNSDNVASQKVLTKAGFAPDGPADPAVIGGRPGVWFRRHLAV